MKQLIGGASVPDRNSTEILAALNSVSNAVGIDAAAIAAIIHTESVWDTRAVTNSYIGLTQVGPDFVSSLGLDKDSFLQLTAAEQISAYGKWLSFYRFSQQLKKYGMNVGDQPIARQAAVLQSMQFSPNGVKWKTAFAAGDFSVPSTNTKQAQFLGDTSIHDMEAYYNAFFKQRPPSYSNAFEALTAEAALSNKRPRGSNDLSATIEFDMAPPTKDGQFIATMLTLSTESDKFGAIQRVAAQRLIDYDGEIYPSDGCAITLSVLLQTAGIKVPDTFMAFDLGNLLRRRGWQVVPVGSQKPGDVGSTCGQSPHHGVDHIYFVVKVLNGDEMVVADNQAESVHFRWASGNGKSPTTFFLRPLE